MLERVECDDPDRVIELTRHEIANDRPKIGPLKLRFAFGAGVDAIHHEIDGLIGPVGNDEGRPAFVVHHIGSEKINVVEQSSPGSRVPRISELFRYAALVGLSLLFEGRPVNRFVVAIVGLGMTASACQAESGLASYYDGVAHDGVAQKGEMTCAHRTRAFGSMVTVTYAGHSIRCRINDRGPFIRGRVIDVSIGAARALGMMDAGVVLVLVE